MPHIIVKMYPGRSEEQKEELARKITRDVVEVSGCEERVVSVSIQEVEPDQWAETVYRPDILESDVPRYREPGYNPFETGGEKADNTDSLTAYVRSAWEQAALEDSSGMFNPMSWLDLELEDNPGSFDPYFDRPWHELTDAQKADRAMAVRKVL